MGKVGWLQRQRPVHSTESRFGSYFFLFQLIFFLIAAQRCGFENSTPVFCVTRLSAARSSISIFNFHSIELLYLTMRVCILCRCSVLPRPAVSAVSVER